MTPPRRSAPRAARDAEPSDTERKLQGIIALAADAVVSTDDRFRITLFNPAAERMFGYGSDEVIGQSLDMLLPESSRKAHREHLVQFGRTPVASKAMGERGRIWGRRQSGELFAAEASISKIVVGGAPQFTAVIRDVTRERRAEKERDGLLTRETEARAAAELAEQHMRFLANATELLHSSLAYEETFNALLRLLVPELAQCCVIDVLEESGRVRRAHAVHGDAAKQSLSARLATWPRQQMRYLTRRAIEHGESQLVAQVTREFLASLAEDAEHLQLLTELELGSMVIVPLQARGHVVGALALARGASELPYTASDLAFAQALAHRAASALDNARLYDTAQRAIRARDEVLGVVSHDLRNPLSAIAMGASSLLAQGFSADRRVREALETIRDSTVWAQRLIQDLVDVSAIEAGGLSLNRHLEDPALLAMRAVLLHEELANERAIALTCDLADHTCLVRVDGDRIVQALGNLIGNALKFTPPGGAIRVAVTEHGREIQLLVADSGPGVASDDALHVFDRFWTVQRGSRTRGTGMGLAIVRGIVEGHGGRVWLEAAAVCGATFIISLPCARLDGA